MNLGLIFFQFLPLAFYIGFEHWKGFRAGIIAAIAGSVLMVAYSYATAGIVDSFSVGECVLIVVLGAVSLKMENERYFKFQPTVLAFCFALIFIAFEVRGTPILVRYIPQIERLVDAQDRSPEVLELITRLHDAHFIETMAKLSFAMIFVFIAHGLVMAYAALRLTTAQWFLWRLAIYPALLVVTLVIGAVYG
jgi:intracellular septation protein A